MLEEELKTYKANLATADKKLKDFESMKNNQQHLELEINNKNSIIKNLEAVTKLDKSN